MKFYKDAQNKVFAFESDGSQDAFIVAGLTAITQGQADALRVPPVTTPTAITIRQARLALLQSGYLAQVDGMIAALPGVEGDAARIEWEFASDVLRTHPLVAAMAVALSLTSTQLDDLFTLGASL